MSMVEARSVGLRIADRISRAGLDFIRTHDYDLYTDILNQLQKQGRKRRK